MTSDFLFVYGTLTSKFNNGYASFLRENAVFVSNGYIYGALYDLGGYPGLIIKNTSTSKVYGEVYKLTGKISNTIQVLDEYEGFVSELPENNQYIRRLKEIICDERRINCWLYIYNWDITGKPQIMHENYWDYRKPR